MAERREKKIIICGSTLPWFSFVCQQVCIRCEQPIGWLCRQCLYSTVFGVPNTHVLISLYRKQRKIMVDGTNFFFLCAISLYELTLKASHGIPCLTLTRLFLRYFFPLNTKKKQFIVGFWFSSFRFPHIFFSIYRHSQNQIIIFHYVFFFASLLSFYP